MKRGYLFPVFEHVRGLFELLRKELDQWPPLIIRLALSIAVVIQALNFAIQVVFGR